MPGFEPSFKATVDFGADWLSFDPDGEHGRIDLRGMARFVLSPPVEVANFNKFTNDPCRTEEGHAIDFRYTGVIKMAPNVAKIFDGKPDMATVPFGYASMFNVHK